MDEKNTNTNLGMENVEVEEKETLTLNDVGLEQPVVEEKDNVDISTTENETQQKEVEESKVKEKNDSDTKSTKNESSHEELSTKSFTQEQVNDIVRRRLEREEKRLYDEYGVDNKASLEELIGKAQSFDATYSLLQELQEEVKGLREEKWFKEEEVNQEKVNDIRAYFKGSNKELNQESLKEELKTHPEWLKKEEPKITFTSVGSNKSEETQKLTEEEEAAKLFGLRNFRKRIMWR